ncbi:hypothetical protein [Streptomyces sp. RTd22]|uniref:hypothetical protein n=1 Tax=Streptomyces sp. RTd22 TaxID=1841249 RepID=UPI000ABA1E02|nr:hypothetical protein [Streptomyces sp. RTd22]
MLDSEEEGETAHGKRGPPDQGREEGAKRARKQKHCEHEGSPVMRDRRRGAVAEV